MGGEEEMIPGSDSAKCHEVFHQRTELGPGGVWVGVGLLGSYLWSGQIGNRSFEKKMGRWWVCGMHVGPWWRREGWRWEMGERLLSDFGWK